MVTLRVRTKAGTWRFNDVDLSQNLEKFVQRIETEKKISIKKVSLQQNLANEVPYDRNLQSLGLKHGSILFIEVSAGIITIGDTRREIGEDGNIKSNNDGNGFLPGLKSLGDESKNWNLTKMIELQDKYIFKITGDKEELCARASLDTSVCEAFNEYFVQQLQMKQCRCGILLGRFVDSDVEMERKNEEKKRKERDEKYKKAYGSTKANVDLKHLDKVQKFEVGSKKAVIVEAIYEPRQSNSPEKFTLLEDNMEQKADLVAKSLGLSKVGFIVARPKSSKFKGSELMAHEIIPAAQTSLEANDGERRSPFVVVRVSPNEENQITFEAFTLTPKCLDIVAEDALKVLEEDPSQCKVADPFTAIVQMKEKHVVDNDFFVKPVPIVHFNSVLADNKSPMKVPYFNRDLTQGPNQDLVRNFARAKVGNVGGNLDDSQCASICANFNALLFLSRSLNEQELGELGNFLQQRLFKKDAKASLNAQLRLKVKQLVGL